MAAPEQSVALAVAEVPPRCQDEIVVGTQASYELFSHMQGLAAARTIPLNVSLELTLNCNIRCLHCYNLDRDDPHQQQHAACGSGNADRRKPDLSLDEILQLLSDLRDAGCLILGLTGGEVLTYPHLFAVLDRARELNLAVQLLTNGTMLQPGVAARLASYRNLLGVSISLYGATPEVHDGVTQITGSFRRTWDGAQRLRAAGDRRPPQVHRHARKRAPGRGDARPGAGARLSVPGRRHDYVAPRRHARQPGHARDG